MASKERGTCGTKLRVTPSVAECGDISSSRWVTFSCFQMALEYWTSCQEISVDLVEADSLQIRPKISRPSLSGKALKCISDLNRM